MLPTHLLHERNASAKMHVIISLANPALFADDTNMIISKSDPKEFTNSSSRNIIKNNLMVQK
jgi:hypothetical protein